MPAAGCSRHLAAGPTSGPGPGVLAQAPVALVHGRRAASEANPAYRVARPGRRQIRRVQHAGRCHTCPPVASVDAKPQERNRPSYPAAITSPTSPGIAGRTAASFAAMGIFGSTRFGVHAGLQNISMGDLRAAWRRIEDAGYDWISIWDHFYAATDGSDPTCHEAVATHAALACDTSRVRCGSLVYSIGYRHPAVLAKAACAVDHLSGGRADLGLGAGWAQFEYEAYGIPFPAVKVRMDQLEEAVHCVRGLLSGEPFSFEGRYFTFREARCEPGPVGGRIPLWIGGGGEQRTLRIAARYADGWNVPFIAADAFAHKREILRQHCDAVGRDPGEIRCTINLGLAWTEDSLRQQFGRMADYVRPGVLTGTDQEVIDRIGAYVDAGASQINIALRAPFDLDAIDRLAATVGLGGAAR